MYLGLFGSGKGVKNDFLSHGNPKHKLSTASENRALNSLTIDSWT